MADAAYSPLVVSADASVSRHSGIVRLTHWVSTICFFALLLTGVEIIISHPRFYWGEEGNSLTASLFDLPIPASRGGVKTGYNYVLPDQNGWSRYLHFQAGWLLVFAGSLYFIHGIVTRHFQKNLIPNGSVLQSIREHLRFRRPTERELKSYNVLQRVSYMGVVFVLFPAMVWTGLAMSPGFTAAFPFLVDLLGGFQSARTIHFFVTLALVLFVVVHVVMVFWAGFGKRMRLMILGGDV